jgi:hypothetical protein
VTSLLGIFRDHNADGNVSYAEFLDFFHREDPNMGMKKIKNITVTSPGNKYSCHPKSINLPLFFGSFL